MKYLISLAVALALAVIPSFTPFDNHNHRPFLLVQQAEAKQEMVYFNIKTYKYHNLKCMWAQRCTRNCVLISLSEAINRGGIACRVCGG